MAWSGLLVLVVKYAGKFSLSIWGWSCYFVFCTIMAGFGIHLEYEDNNSDLKDTTKKSHKKKQK